VSKNLSELLPDVLLSASGCPPMIATQALSSAVREFLEATSAWKTWVAAIDVVADQATYAFPNHLMDPAEAWARTTSIDMLRWAPTGREIPFMTAADLQDADPQWRTRGGAVPSAWTYEIDSAEVRLYPVPTTGVADALEARLVVSTHTYAGVGATATDTQPVLLPDEVFHKFRDAFVSGALARLYAVPRRDWTDYQAARYHREAFERAKIDAKSEADVDYNDVGLTVNYGGY
jgi:hypothetical protein